LRDLNSSCAAYRIEGEANIDLSLNVNNLSISNSEDNELCRLGTLACHMTLGETITDL